MKKNPPLAIRSIQQNLTEALGELEELWALIQIAVFGRLLPNELEPRKEYADRLAERLPLTDCDLFYSLDHAYHHLNFAWNCRRATEERARACATADFVRWSRFPKGAPFLDLQPLPRRAKGPPREVGIALVRPSDILHAHVQMAVRHLSILRDMATVAAGKTPSSDTSPRHPRRNPSPKKPSAATSTASTATWTPSGHAAAAPTFPSPAAPTSAARASRGSSSLQRRAVWGDDARQTPTRRPPCRIPP
jgi:hypothetical protein